MRTERNDKCKSAQAHCSTEFIFLKDLVKFRGKYNRNTPKKQVATGRKILL